MRRAVPSRPETAPSAGSASISNELQVVAALHEIGADLGDPLEVKRSEGKVLVSGIGLPPSRQQEIQLALDSIPNVVLEFGAVPAAPDMAATPATPAVGVRPGAMQ